MDGGDIGHFGSFMTFAWAGVRRTNFDEKMLIDKHFAYRGADSHRFGATHPLFSFKSGKSILV
ncbi:MAG: hypothetical protein HN975_15275 [Anaerolineae bacterium]|jgi:hypothetical protein|nr:hypothetical protein [Anaerolineae bacterium]